MTSLVLTVRETLRYRGAIGQWSWVLHRISGLGVVLFLVLHVIDTSWSVFAPEEYVKAIASYQTPLFTLGEFALVACVVYHAFNGLRIIIFDFRPDLWHLQQKAAYAVIALTVIVLVPVFLGMFGHVLDFYGEEGQFVLSLDRVIAMQLPFVVGIIAAIIAALVLSSLYGMVAGDETDALKASQLERFWWSFMRISGILIVPLVFSHLAAMHVAQGVFDLTAANHPIIGTLEINESGTAVEFVRARWSFVAGGLYIWKIVDFTLLTLVTLHGLNGLRYVLTDYTANNVMLRRAMTYVTIIGIVVLMVTGGGALLGTIERDAITMAEHAMARLQCEQDASFRDDCEAVLSDEGSEDTNADEPAADESSTSESGDS